MESRAWKDMLLGREFLLQLQTIFVSSAYALRLHQKLGS